MANQSKFDRRMTIVIRGPLIDVIQNLAIGTGHKPAEHFRGWLYRHFKPEIDALAEKQAAAAGDPVTQPPLADLSTAESDDGNPRF